MRNMRGLVFLVAIALSCYCVENAAESASSEQKILRRVIKSTPTATNLSRIKLVHVRSTPGGVQERGKVTEISGKEAATFGMRNNNTDTTQSGAKTQSGAQPSTSTTAPAVKTADPTTTAAPATTSSAPTSTTTSATSTTTISTTVTPVAPSAGGNAKPASERQVASSPEVELLVHSPSWQTMTAVEAPAAMLIAAGARKSGFASQANDLSFASSSRQLINTNNQLIADESSSGDVLRSSSVKGGQLRQSSFSTGETFARLRQQHSSKTNHQQHKQQQQQSFFYPPASQQLKVSKTSESTKTSNLWYQPTTTSTTTPRPAPIIQQRYEQQSDNYVEQQAELSAPPGEAEPFAFDFKTEDQSGNGQYRKEESDKNGVVKGSYGYTDANGIYRHVEYIADQNGFRANIKSNEPGLNVGETQPASIEMARSSSGSNTNSEATTNNRLVAASYPSNDNNGAYDSSNDNSGDWSAPTSSNNNINDGTSSSAGLAAIASPDFESSHKPESIRSRRHFRN